MAGNKTVFQQPIKYGLFLDSTGVSLSRLLTKGAMTLGTRLLQWPSNGLQAENRRSAKARVVMFSQIFVRIAAHFSLLQKVQLNVKDITTFQVNFFLQWPIGEQPFRFSHQRSFLDAALSHTRPTTGRHDRQPRGELGGAELPLGVRVRFRKVFDQTG